MMTLQKSKQDIAQVKLSFRTKEIIQSHIQFSLKQKSKYKKS